MEESELLLLFGMVICGLVFFVSQWVWGIPRAYAWDPNSHDKMTTYSLALLESSEPKSLFGWVLGKAKQAKYSSKQYIEDQIRRGSIEEDMNSYILINSSTLGLDGTNGSYHFYNPIDGEGLSDSDNLTNIAATVTYCDTVMPSALQRAASLDESLDKGFYFSQGEENMSWHFDRELRNYTVVDGVRYFVRGYQHLGFYAIGRIVHLLQDMAVPAHVRNDSHSGKAGDPKDPLEQFADEADGNKKDWTFSAERVYSPAGKNVFNKAREIWNAERHGYYNQTAGLFKSLSGWTYENFYSVNTIPGNYDSHNPEKVRERPFLAQKDLGKCHPATFQLALLLNSFGKGVDANVSQILPQCFSTRRSDEILAHVTVLKECKTRSNRCIINEDCNDFSISEKRHTCEQCVIDVQSIVHSIKAITNEMDAMLATYEGYATGQIPTVALDSRMVEGFRLQGEMIPRVCRQVLTDYGNYNLAALVNGVGSGIVDSNTALEHWIESFPSQQAIIDVLRNLEIIGITYNVRPNAPYCLNYELIHHQWITAQPQAVAFGAYLLANWFEWQYNPRRTTGSVLGVGLWLNENAKEGEDPILHAVQKITMDNSVPLKGKETVTLGVANHLPCPMDMVVEIELVEEDDFLKEHGVEIALNWGRLSPDWGQVADGEFLMAEGAALPKKKVWTGEVVQEQVGMVVGEAITKVVLSGSGGRQQVKILLEQTEPYNLGLLKGFPIPKEGSNDGGITRTEETAGILQYTLNATPGEREGRDEINTSLLRMEFSTPAPVEEGS